MQRTAVILFGPPGSGKGTQTDKLLEPPCDYMYIGTGQSLRAIVAEGGELGLTVKAQMGPGHLVDDELVNQVVQAALQKLTLNTIPLFDGYPRNLAQAHLLYSTLKKLGFTEIFVIRIHVSEEVCMERLAIRIADYKARNQPLRDDDNEVSFGKRLTTYENETMPAVRFFQLRSRIDFGIHYSTVDGSQSINRVAIGITDAFWQEQPLAHAS